MEPSLTFRRGEEIDQRQAGVCILKRYWKGFAPQDASEWSRRISIAGGYIVAVYVGNAIAAILEAMRLDIEAILTACPPRSKVSQRVGVGKRIASRVTQ